ncbi:MAG: FAD:protein FMN transferase [Verrucomicrobiaceae bacterium]|nr:FAD:protein FMN transferase [Verrucomicrobiaceae bacterium]
MSEHFRFRHEAMATVFEVVIAQPGVDAGYARSAADAVFVEIDRLEEELSRFRATSDIWRISQLRAGESAAVGLAAWDCLSLAKAVHAETGGAFDITIGPLMNLWRNEDGSPRQPDEEDMEWARGHVGSHHFDLDTGGLRVSAKVSGLVYDLGAVGKGYALDQCVQVLDDWSIENALLNAGDSTILGIGAPEGDPGWIVTLGGDQEKIVRLKDRAISSSGFAVKGAHIMDPRTLRPAAIRESLVHVSAPTAALSDALSTAFMVMTPEEIQELCRRHPGVEIIA